MAQPLQRLIIDMSGRKGLTQKWFGDFNRHGYDGDVHAGQPNLRYLVEDGEIVSGIFNPITKHGYISPSANTFRNVPVLNSGTTINRVVPVNLVLNDVRDIYFGCNNGHLYISQTYYNSGVYDAVTVSGALATFYSWTDACQYSLNGSEKLFFAWVNSTGSGYISTIDSTDYTGSSWNENWSKNDVSTATSNLVFSVPSLNLKFVVSSDSFLYILAGRKLHRLDGSTIGGTQGTLYEDILVGQANTVFTDGIEYKNNLYLIVKKGNVTNDYNELQPFHANSSETNFIGIYLWNKQSSFFNSSNFIQLNGIEDVKSIYITPTGNLRIIAITGSGATKIMEYNGTTFVSIQNLPYGSHPTTSKGIKSSGDLIYWLGSDGFIYAHGSDIPGEKELLFIIGQLPTSGSGSVVGGSLAIVSTTTGDTPPSNYKPSDVIWLSYGTSNSNGYLKTFYPYSYNTITGI